MPGFVNWPGVRSSTLRNSGAAISANISPGSRAQGWGSAYVPELRPLPTSRSTTTAMPFRGTGVVPAGFTNAGSEYYRVIMADAPICYVRLDETASIFAIDSASISGGTYSNMASIGDSGLITDDPDFAATFSFGTSNVAIDNVPDFGAGPVSVEMWFKRTTTTLDKGLFARPGAGATHWGMNLIGSTGLIHFFGGTTPGAVVGTTNVNDTNLHHVVGMKGSTAGDWQIFIDGQDVSSAIVSATPTSNTGVVNIGQDLASDFFIGKIDEFAIYNVKLSAQQVMNHYNAGLTYLNAQATLVRQAVNRASTF